MTPTRKEKSARSLKWYHENKEAVLEKKKSRPKITCHLCDREIYADRLLYHETTNFHKKNLEEHNKKEAVDRLQELEEKFTELQGKYNTLKKKYNRIKKNNN